MESNTDPNWTETKPMSTETLGAKQERFARALPGLLVAANSLAPVRLGDLFRDPRVHGEMGVKMGYGHASSCHKLKLAIDINFVVDGKIDGPEIQALHERLHDWFDKNGGAKRIPHDMNHYSFEHNGCR